MASPRDLALTTTGDLDVEAGGRLIEGTEAIAQELRIRLRTFLGEYFLDTTKGLPWLTWTSTKPTPDVLRQVEALVRAEVARTSGVVRVPQAGVVATYLGSTRTISVTVDGVTTDLGLLDQVQVEV